MIIKLTNLSNQFKGEPILINIDMALSIYEGPRVDEDGNEDRVTYIFAPPHGSWEVKETPEQIMKLIKR